MFIRFITFYLYRFRRKPAISSLYGLSPLFTTLLSILQHTRVRSSWWLFLQSTWSWIDHLTSGHIWIIFTFIFSFSLSFLSTKIKPTIQHILTDPWCKRYNIAMASVIALYAYKHTIYRFRFQYWPKVPFHLSITVLVHYRSIVFYSDLESVFPLFQAIIIIKSHYLFWLLSLKATGLLPSLIIPSITIHHEYCCNLSLYSLTATNNFFFSFFYFIPT